MATSDHKANRWKGNVSRYDIRGEVFKVRGSKKNVPWFYQLASKAYLNSRYCRYHQIERIASSPAYSRKGNVYFSPLPKRLPGGPNSNSKPFFWVSKCVAIKRALNGIKNNLCMIGPVIKKKNLNGEMKSTLISISRQVHTLKLRHGTGKELTERIQNTMWGNKKAKHQNCQLKRNEVQVQWRFPSFTFHGALSILVSDSHPTPPKPTVLLLPI